MFDISTNNNLTPHAHEERHYRVKRHPQNKHLTLIDGLRYRDLPLMERHGPYIREYLDSLIDVLNKAWSQHPRLLIIRFELILLIADSNTLESYIENFMKRFIGSLESQLLWSQKKAKMDGKRVHETRVRYVWVREESERDRDHIHVAIILNYDAFRVLGRYDSEEDNMANRIRRAAARTMGLPSQQGKMCVHFPKNPTYAIRGWEDIQTYEKVFRRLSYLCKQDTKVYGDRSHSFGCSRK